MSSTTSDSSNKSGSDMNASDGSQNRKPVDKGKIAILLNEAERMRLEKQIKEIQSRLVLVRVNYFELARMAARLALMVEQSDDNNAKNQAKDLRVYLMAMGLDPETGRRNDVSLNPFKVA